MGVRKLPPPPRGGSIEEVNRWISELYIWAGQSSVDGVRTQDGKLTIFAVEVPAVPVISQQLLSLPIGYQFAFNFATSGTVDGYWIYKGATTSSTSASRYKFVPQSNNGGIYTFQDNVGGSTAYYWVSAINQKGESALEPAFVVTIPTAPLPSTNTMTVYRPSVSSSSDYTPPTAAYDDNLNQGATASCAGTTSRQTTWSGFPAPAGVPTAISLKIVSRIPSAVGTYSAQLSYSLDGGGSWTIVYDDSVSSLTNRTDAIVLPPLQNMTLVKVAAYSQSENTFDGEGRLELSRGVHSIFEIWAEVTT
jgi:hypothetical protein